MDHNPPSSSSSTLYRLPRPTRLPMPISTRQLDPSPCLPKSSARRQIMVSVETRTAISLSSGSNAQAPWETMLLRRLHRPRRPKRKGKSFRVVTHTRSCALVTTRPNARTRQISALPRSQSRDRHQRQRPSNDTRASPTSSCLLWDLITHKSPRCWGPWRLITTLGSLQP